jgi:hypothetical protein
LRFEAKCATLAATQGLTGKTQTAAFLPAQETYGKLGVPFEGEIGHHFANYGSELKTVAGKACGECDRWVDWMDIEYEVFIGSHGIEAIG